MVADLFRSQVPNMSEDVDLFCALLVMLALLFVLGALPG
jgi:hypothetical protein